MPCRSLLNTLPIAYGFRRFTGYSKTEQEHPSPTLPCASRKGGSQARRLNHNRLAAHSANFSRPILALWRMSTGKPVWRRKVSIPAVCG